MSIQITQTPVNEILQDGDPPLTIPTGEVWSVNVSINSRNVSGSGRGTFLQLNGTDIAGKHGNMDEGPHHSFSFKAVFVSGQTLEVSKVSGVSADANVMLSGFVVSDTFTP